MSIAYTLIRSNRKTISLQIKPDLEVIVRAPQRMAKRDIDAFVKRHAQWIDTHVARLRERADAHPEPDAAETERLREAARAYIPPRVAYYAQQMGLTPSAIKITAAKTRFGSCSGKNNLCFSYLLMRYPEAAIDYVIVHELAHIVHKNHSQAFYSLVAQYMPDQKARRALLRQ